MARRFLLTALLVVGVAACGSLLADDEDDEKPRVGAGGGDASASDGAGGTNPQGQDGGTGQDAADDVTIDPDATLPQDEPRTGARECAASGGQCLSGQCLDGRCMPFILTPVIGAVRGIAVVTSQDVYFTTAAGLYRWTATNGSQALAAGTYGPVIALGTKLYWSTGSSIKTMNAGAVATSATQFASGLPDPLGSFTIQPAVNDTAYFVSPDGTKIIGHFAPSSSQTDQIINLTGARSIDADPQDPNGYFWTQQGEIRVGSFLGSTLVRTIKGASGVATRGEHVYFPTGPGDVRRMRRSGTGEELIARTAASPLETPVAVSSEQDFMVYADGSNLLGIALSPPPP